MMANVRRRAPSLTTRSASLSLTRGGAISVGAVIGGPGSGRTTDGPGARSGPVRLSSKYNPDRDLSSPRRRPPPAEPEAELPRRHTERTEHVVERPERPRQGHREQVHGRRQERHRRQPTG